MKSTIYIAIATLLLISISSCRNDDSDFSAYITPTVLYITYDGTQATVSGDTEGIVSVSGAHVTVNSLVSDSMLIVLSGSTTDGSLLVNRREPHRFTITLNGVTINNPNGPAINNQCGKSLSVRVADGTTNTLSDGTSYTEQSYQQKGTLFSEGQILFGGSGTLNIVGNCKNAIASDDYVSILDNIVLNITASATGRNGIKTNDGIYVYGGTTTISTAGDCVYDESTLDYSSVACLKTDSVFVMKGGTVTATSTGDGGKGVSCDNDVTIAGGTLTVTTTGTNINSKPKGIKSDTSITMSGGTLSVDVEKSWALDNASESEDPADHITIIGSPTTSVIEKKSVRIEY